MVRASCFIDEADGANVEVLRVGYAKISKNRPSQLVPCTSDGGRLGIPLVCSPAVVEYSSLRLRQFMTVPHVVEGFLGVLCVLWGLHLHATGDIREDDLTRAPEVIFYSV